jgi:D-lactate dehydrogenase (cytochrome)
MFDPITDPSIIAGYLTDASNIMGHCEALCRPRTAVEAAEIVAHCQTNNIPLTITGARTSTTAAPVPFGGWLLSMEHFFRVHHIAHDSAKADAGIILGSFQSAIEETGRFFPPDPTSRHDCTLGAAVACNASGARSFKYGPIRPWITGLTVILPTGELLTVTDTDPIPPDWPVPQWTEPAVKTAAGYCPTTRLIDLFIGQEGTLGLIVDITVKLTDLPTDVISFFAFFPSRNHALDFLTVARSAVRDDPHGALSPRCIEYLDHHCLDIARDRVEGIPSEAQAGLFLEQELWDKDEMAYLTVWWEALEDHTPLADHTIVAADPPTHQALLALRHAIPAGLNEQVVRNGMPKVGTDLAVPDDALAEMMTAYESCPLPHALFGHIGDNHLHLNILPTTETELALARAFYDQLSQQAVALGGTVSAEHGIGKTKKRALVHMVGVPVIDAFKRLKTHLDPNGILGRGVLFDSI